MKKIYFSLFAILGLTTISVSQTLDSANYVPLIGETQLYYLADTGAIVLPAGSPGTTWDYSMLSARDITNPTNTTYYIDPTTTTETANYTNATIADTSAGNSANVVYSSATATGMYSEGYVLSIPSFGTGIVRYNADNEQIMEFPFALGNTFTDPFLGVITGPIPIGTMNLTGSITVTADGQGTLLLPNSVSLPNVLRVKRTDSLYAVQTPIPLLNISIVTTLYDYYDITNSKFPVLTFMSNDITGAVATSIKSVQSQYPLNTPTSINNLASNSIELNIFPNPVNDFTTLSFNLKNSASVKIDLINNIGQKIKEISSERLPIGKNQIKLNTSNLAPGAYFISISANNQHTNKKLIVN